MTNLGRLMQQAQEMQAKMAEFQEQLVDTEIEGGAGGGMVTIRFNGKGEAKAVSIDPALAEADDIEVLEDLVVAAINDARAKIETLTAEQMSKMTGGLGLPPGMKLPF
jgi:DNA-binding YbaB/EbfC family protein